MANITVKKTVFKKDDFVKAVDTTFSTYVEPVVEVDNDTVEELFRLYNKLYFEIPVEGDTNSHRFLVNKSSELAKFVDDLQDIQPLLDEIAQLRRQLLDYQQQIIDLNIAQAEQ